MRSTSHEQRLLRRPSGIGDREKTGTERKRLSGTSPDDNEEKRLAPVIKPSVALGVTARKANVIGSCVLCYRVVGVGGIRCLTL